MKQFIKQNLKLLTSQSQNQIKDLKRKKNDFWRKLKTISIPKNQEVAYSTIVYLIKTKRISNQDEFDDLINISEYLSKFLIIKDVETILTEIYTKTDPSYSKTFLKKEDFKEIKKEDYHQIKKRDINIDDFQACEVDITFKEKLELLRRYGYDILINRFEPLLRTTIINEVLIINYGSRNWIREIPKGVIEALEEMKDLNANICTIEDFFEESFFWCLKEIAVFSDHYKHLNNLINNLPKNKFIEVMDNLNENRKKISHAKSTFSASDLTDLIFNIKLICQGELGKGIIEYIDNELYLTADEIPYIFFDEYECPNNLPSEDYDLVGGFIGRQKEIKRVIQLLYSDQDRIVSINGAGGIGKTAVALKASYKILADRNNPFEAIMWFTAKEETLTAYGIVPVDSKIKTSLNLIKDILSIIDPGVLDILDRSDISQKIYEDNVYKILSSRKCLLIIDNLETIKDEDIIEFIKDIPRPSQVLITSRKGLGEIERRYELPDFAENDAIKLFRVIARVRNRKDLLKLPDDNIKNLVRKVRCYPLLLKWAIGRVCLGKIISEAFSEIYSGKSDIAQFVFNDVFSSLKKESKSCLYSMIVYGDKPITRHFLMHLANLDRDTFDDVIRELIFVSFVYTENIKTERDYDINYYMLSLTRGFVKYKLNENKKEFNAIQSRLFELSKQIEEFDKSHKIYYQSLESIGVTTDDDKIAFNYVKSAKRYKKVDDNQKAEEAFELAIEISPNFPYALNEFAKFKSKQGYIHESNGLFEKSIKADPDNWHSYFHYGIDLKHQNKIHKSIEALEKAKELNPNYYVIHSVLARVYTFQGDYGKADDLFNEVNENEKFIDYRKKIMRLEHQADNYNRWSRTYFDRGDFNGGLEKLYKALNIIEMERNNITVDISILKLEKSICLDIAISLSKNNKFDESLPYFKRAHKKLRLKSGIIVNADEVRSRAYYYIAKYGFETNKILKEKINKYIKKGLSISQKKEYIQKFKKLAQYVNNLPDVPLSEKKYGYIKYFNFQRKYGIINSEGDSYIFFKQGFYQYVDDKTLIELEGKDVSFILKDDPNKPGKKVATLITFEANLS